MKELKDALKRIESPKDDDPSQRGSASAGNGDATRLDDDDVDDDGLNRRSACICGDAGADMDPNWTAPCCGKPPRLCDYFWDLVQDVHGSRETSAARANAAQLLSSSLAPIAAAPTLRPLCGGPRFVSRGRCSCGNGGRHGNNVVGVHELFALYH